MPGVWLLFPPRTRTMGNWHNEIATFKEFNTFPALSGSKGCISTSCHSYKLWSQNSIWVSWKLLNGLINWAMLYSMRWNIHKASLSKLFSPELIESACVNSILTYLSVLRKLTVQICPEISVRTTEPSINLHLAEHHGTVLPMAGKHGKRQRRKAIWSSLQDLSGLDPNAKLHVF